MKDGASPPYAYDDEILLKIGDFYPQDDHAIESQLTGNPWMWAGDPMSLLVNGHSGTAPNKQNPHPSDSSCWPWMMDVEPDKTYRIRLIGSTTLSLVIIGFEDHDNLTIIETDNSYVYPTETSYMQVDTGQRFSFLLKAKSLQELESAGGKTRYWIQLETREAERVVSAWAILNYVHADTAQRQSSAPDSENGNPFPASTSPASDSQDLVSVPTEPILDLPTNVTVWHEYTFRNPPLPGYGTPPTMSEVSRRITISTLQFLNESSGYTTMISNNETWFDNVPLGPTTRIPYLVEILENSSINGFIPDYDRATANAGFDPLSQTYPLRIGEVIEIVWQNAASHPAGIYGPHPLHAHGGPYWDMGSGWGVYSPETHVALLELHSTNGVPYAGSRRDTTMLYKYTLQSPQPGEVNGWRVWRIRVTEKNVGVWMMHCHILQHMIMGQQTVWVFGTPEEIRASMTPVEGSLEGYFTFGGNVVGQAGQGKEGIDVAHFYED